MFLRIMWIILKECLFFVWHQDKSNMQVNIFKQLADVNIFYVKMFQAISCNTELFSSKVTNALIEYTDNAPYTDDDIDFSFVGDLEENDIYLDNETPINSGVIALVFTASKLDNNGNKLDERYVIKAKRRNIEERLRVSINEMSMFIYFISWLPYLNKLNLVDVFEENIQSIRDQVDFMKECQNTEYIQKLNKRIDYIVIPNVYPEYTKENPNIIVMDYIKGTRLVDILPEDKETYCEILAKFSIKCIFFDGVYHGDMHQGNLIFLKDESDDPNDKADYKVAAIDYGITGSLTREEQNYFYEFIKLATNDQIYEAAKLMLNRITEPKSILANLSIPDEIEIVNDISNLIKEAFIQNNQITPHDIYLISNLLSKKKLKLARYFCKVQLAYMINEGVCTSLSTDKPFMQFIKEIIKENFD